MKNEIHMANGITKYHLLKRRTPLAVSYLSTHRCNQNCSYCNWDKSNLSELSTGQAIKLIYDMAQYGVVKLGFAGGESLVREDIDLLLEYSYKRKLIVSLSSNGRDIQKHIDTIKKYVDIVQISFDGPKEIHDALRGFGSHQVIIEAIQLLKEYGIKFITNTVLTNQNIPYIDYILSCAKRYGFMALFQPIFAYELSEENSIKQLKPTYHEMLETINYLIERKKSGMPVGNSIAFLKYVLNTWGVNSRFQCLANKLFCAIDPTGHMKACCFDPCLDEQYNAVTQGFGCAFEKSVHNDYSNSCKGCFCNAYIETNLAFSLNLSACFNALNLM